MFAACVVQETEVKRDWRWLRRRSSVLYPAVCLRIRPIGCTPPEGRLSLGRDEERRNETERDETKRQTQSTPSENHGHTY